MELLGSFEKELAKHEKNRQELANAEKLFDLPITMYPELIKVQKEMTGLRMIYNLYESLKVLPLPDTPKVGHRDLCAQVHQGLRKATVPSFWLQHSPFYIRCSFKERAEGGQSKA